MNLSQNKEYKVKIPNDGNVHLDEYGYANLIFKGYIDDNYQEVNINNASGLLFFDPTDPDEEPIVIVKSTMKVGDIIPTNVQVTTKKPVISNKYQRSRTGGKKSKKSSKKHKKTNKKHKK